MLSLLSSKNSPIPEEDALLGCASNMAGLFACCVVAVGELVV